MSYWQKTKLIGPLLLFNILLPTWDVYSDAKLTVKLFMGENQSCSIEEENVQEFRQQLDLCLQNPEEYCQSDSNATYLCQETSTSTTSCMNSSYSVTSSEKGIRKIYYQCLTNNTDYCSDSKTYHGICEEVTRVHYKFGILLLGKESL